MFIFFGMKKAFLIFLFLSVLAAALISLGRNLSSSSFENADELHPSVSNEHYDDVATAADTARIKILGYDRDGNGVRDDLDSLIDAKIPDSPEKRAAYRYLAQTIQNQWIAFYDNPQMTYEELLPYEVLASLGGFLINELNAKTELKWNVFQAQLHNSLERIMFDDKIDRIFVGKMLPVAVKLDKRYSSLVAEGMNTYNEMLTQERMK